MSPFILSAFIFCVWPMLIGFIGYQVGRRRLVIRSPIQINRLAAEPDEESDSERPQSLIKRLANRDVGFGR